MRRNIFSLTLLLSVAFILASCLGTDDDTQYYADTAITSFSLGTLNRTVHTTSSTGKDSTYSTTVTGSLYSFNIDQANGLIYNTDSLPIGTDNSKVISTISSKNSGLIIYKSLTSDTLNYYSSSDSIDFSSPREFRVYSTNGSGYRKYEIHVNVHQQDSDTIVWKKMAVNSSIASMKKMRAVENNSILYVFGTNGSNTEIYSSAASDGKSWSKLNTNMTLDADAYKNSVVNDGYIYVISNGTILKSSNGSEWSSVAQNSDVKQLVGASTTEMYALNSNNKLLVSKNNGSTWSTDNIDGDEAYLPSQDINYTSAALKSNAKTDRIVLVGNRAQADGDTTAVVWTKLVEYSDDTVTSSWEQIEKGEDNHYNYLPNLTSLVVIPYENGMLAFGGKGINSDKVAFSRFYKSYDNGLTWNNNKHYLFPDGFDCSVTSFTAVSDESNNIWIICGESGQIWRGHLSQLGWTNYQSSYTE